MHLQPTGFPAFFFRVPFSAYVINYQLPVLFLRIKWVIILARRYVRTLEEVQNERCIFCGIDESVRMCDDQYGCL